MGPYRSGCHCVDCEVIAKSDAVFEYSDSTFFKQLMACCSD